jgi:cytochrome P450
MLNDPRIWGKDAHLFRPERFVETPTSELPDMETLVYGFGRR